MAQPSSHIKIGPWGGRGNNSFDIGQVAVAMTKVKLYIGEVVNGLEITYANGQTFLAGRKIRGSDEFQLETGDYINWMLGSFKVHDGETCITELEFKTHAGKHYGPFGQGGGENFIVPVVVGQIAGLFGQYGSYINSVGVALTH